MNYHLQKNVFVSIVLSLSLGLIDASGADLVLREHATLEGPIVRLGDVADVSTGSMSVLKELTFTPLVPAPAPGSPRYLQRSEILDLLASRGIDTQALRISGAAVVEIGKSGKAAKGR